MRSPPSVVSGLFAGRYAIERQIGQGASAIVYLARDTQAGAAVALKILRSELAESRASQRFLKEIRRTTALQHPHILPVLDSGEHEGQLYFALPYMEGGTLRHLLKREKHLELSRVIEISRTIAEALDYAHQRGLIHRDVKPENILFTSGKAVLGDFGIARAIDVSGSGGTDSTSRNTVRGTPAYMSPEQAAGGMDLDGRTDLYSLACVTYEMITGMQAFIGPTAESVISQRFVHPPREIRVYRPTAPASLDVALAKAFSTTPADRYRSAGEFAIAVTRAINEENGQRAQLPGAVTREATRWPVAAALLVTFVLAVSGIAVWLKGQGNLNSGTEPGSASQLDVSRYAVFPPDSLSGVPAPIDVTALLRDALRRWNGIAVVDAFHVRDALGRESDGLANEPDVRRASIALGAGRYIRLQVGTIMDSIRVAATLFDTRTNNAVADRVVRIPTDFAGAEEALSQLADSLLFPSARGISRESAVGTRSHPAHAAFLRGDAALEVWDLALADESFGKAVEQDPEYAQAYLWLAQVRSWRREPPSRWAFAAEKAARAKGSLSSRDSMLAVALVAMTTSRHEGVCEKWSKLAELDQFDFAAWYGLGNCLAFDTIVVRDARSPSGWRFRSSYHQALKAYSQAFTLLPSIHRSFRGGWFEDIQRILKTNANALRRGSAFLPDTIQFRAYPSWGGDTLQFVPFPTEYFDKVSPQLRTSAVNEAVTQQRRRFYQLATMWRAAFPRSVDAVHALAASLDLMGDPSALDTLRLARQLATEADDRLRIGVMEVWMRVKTAVPSSRTSLTIARALADSLLRFVPKDPQQARLLASVAALLGKAETTASWAAMADGPSMPVALASVGPTLLAYAAFGGPGDSLIAIETRVDRVVRASLSPAEQGSARANTIIRAGLLAIPNYVSPMPAAGTGIPNLLLSAWQRRDLRTAQTIMGQLLEVRRRGAIRASDQTIDVIYAEAAMLHALGDTHGAIKLLSPTLDSLFLTPPQLLADGVRAASLVRAMALRAEMASVIGDPVTAQRWANAVVVLWSEADPFLKQIVSRMKKLAKI